MYSQPVIHNHRAAIVILVDGSTSMLQQTVLGGMRATKADVVAQTVNYMIDELVVRCSRRSTVRNYIDIAVLGYASQGVESLLPGDANGFIAIDRLADLMPQPQTIYIDHRTPEGRSIAMPFTIHEWIKPLARGNTPMVEGLIYTYKLLDKWCRDADHRSSFPPIAIHISDGNCNDGDTETVVDLARMIRETRTEDGNTIFVNIHLSSCYDIISTNSEVFPAERGFATEDADKMLLYRMSSTVPRCFEGYLRGIMHLKSKGPYRAVAFNAMVNELISILNIGTESLNNIRNL